MYKEEIKYHFNIANVQMLVDAYNETIEYYSSTNNYQSDIYLNALHNLLSRLDVQCLLSKISVNQLSDKWCFRLPNGGGK